MATKLHIAGRLPNNYDAISYRLFFNLLKLLNRPSTAIYTRSILLESTFIENCKSRPDQFKYYNIPGVKTLEEQVANDGTGIIIIGIKDHLSGSDYALNVPMEVAEKVKSLVRSYPDKKFIIMTSLEFLHLSFDEPNAAIVKWGGDILNQQLEYQKISPIIDKNFDSPYNFISLNRHPRGHRHLAVALLHQLNLENKGLISWLSPVHQTHMFQNGFGWAKELSQSKYNDIFNAGLLKLQNTNKSNFNIDQDDRYDTVYPDWLISHNIFNWERKLSTYYKNTFVEIVSETTFKEPTLLLTEKTYHAFLGCNFPILNSTVGTVEHLREIGFDMYDDIIDHSYDTITDPFERVYTLITKNQELLSNGEKIRKLWKDNLDRMLKNIDFMRDRMCKIYEDRFYQDVDAAIKKLFNQS
jgi:hypothetical protein